MKNEIFVNVGLRETRVAVREQDQIVELVIEREARRPVVGGIYMGKVTRVLPGMQAAFVDIGLERAGFLYVSDYRGDLDDVELEDEEPSGRRRAAAAQRGAGAQIQDLLSEGAEVLVQVAKEPLGTKGARITSRISLPGRHLVLMPWVNRVGVSRRIEGDRERRRLRAVVDRHRPKDLGFIVRTVSHGISEAELQADIEYLTSLWREIQRTREAVSEVPAFIYQDPPLHLRVLRDLATRETKQIVVDDAQAYGDMQEFVQRFMASPRPRIVHYRSRRPLFDAYRIEGEIEEGLGRKVWLRSGGYLIIDQSEALTAIDINTGRFVGGKTRNLEETILRTNLEAVREIVHQLRFRNIGGLIILDLIDMEVPVNREKVFRALMDALREDKAKVNILKISELGLVEMTRKRTRENLVQQLCEPCPNCEGTGYVQSAETVVHKIFRELPKAAGFLRGERLVLHACTEVVELLGGEEAPSLARAAERVGRPILLRAAPEFHREHFEIESEGALTAPLELDEPLEEESASPEPSAASEEGPELVPEEPLSAREPGDGEYAEPAPDFEREPAPALLASPFEED